MVPSEDQNSPARVQRAPRKGSRAKILGVVLTALSLAGIALATLFAAPDLSRAAAETPLWCLVCGDDGLTDVIQNIFFFVPLGASLMLLGMGWRRAVLAGGLVAITVELLQLFLIAGRDASLSDLITNTLGTAIGAGAMQTLRAPGFPSPSAARRLLLGAVGSLAVLWTAGAWLLAPDLVPAPWVAVLTPSVKDHATYPGTVESVLIAGVLVRDTTRLPDAVAENFAEATSPVTVTLPAPGPRQYGAIVVVEGQGGTPQLLIAATRAGATKMTLRIRASRFRLRPLRFYAARAFAAEPGTPISLEYTRTPGELRVSGVVGTTPYQSQQQLGPHWLFTLASPIPAWAGAGWTALAFVWVAALFGLAGFAAVARAQPVSREPVRVAVTTWVPLVALAIWMLVVNAVADYRSVPVVGWVMCVLGVGVGALVGKRKREEGRGKR